MIQVPVRDPQHMGNLMRVTPVPVYKGNHTFLPSSYISHFVAMPEDYFVPPDSDEVAQCMSLLMSCQDSHVLKPASSRSKHTTSFEYFIVRDPLVFINTFRHSLLFEDISDVAPDFDPIPPWATPFISPYTTPVLTAIVLSIFMDVLLLKRLKSYLRPRLYSYMCQSSFGLPPTHISVCPKPSPSSPSSPPLPPPPPPPPPHSPYELQQLRRMRIRTNPFGSVPIMSHQHHSVNAADRDTLSSFRSPDPRGQCLPARHFSRRRGPAGAST